MWDLQTIAAITGLTGVNDGTLVWPIYCRVAERKQMVELENNLRDRKTNHSTWKHSNDHLMLNASLSREQIEKAAKQSKKINGIPESTETA